MARPVDDQGKGWGSWWETQESLLKAIDMSLEKTGQPILVNRVFLDLKGGHCLLHKIKLEPIWLV